MNELINKHKKVSLFLLSFLVIVFGCYFFFYSKPEIIKEKIVGCEEYYDNFRKINKTTKLDLLVMVQGENSSAYNKIYSSWLDLKDSLTLEECNLFIRSKIFDKRIYKITEFFRQADEANLENKTSDALSFYWQANEELDLLKEDNDIFNADTIFLSMYKPIQTIKEASNKDEAAESLEVLKFQFTELKQYKISQEYVIILDKMEKEIAKLDKLFYGPEYIYAQKAVYELFMEIYYKY